MILYASHSLSPRHPSSSLLLQLVCFCLSIQVFTQAVFFFSPISSILFHPSPPTYKTSFLSQHKGSYVLLCVMLVSRSRSCSGSLQIAPCRHSPHVPAVLLQTAIMCLSAAQHGGEWRLFSMPPDIYLTPGWLQVDEWHKAPSSDACDGSKARPPAGPPKQPFCGSVSHVVMGIMHTWCVCNTVCMCLMKCQISACCCALKAVIQCIFAESLQKINIFMFKFSQSNFQGNISPVKVIVKETKDDRFSIEYWCNVLHMKDAQLHQFFKCVWICGWKSNQIFIPFSSIRLNVSLCSVCSSWNTTWQYLLSFWFTLATGIYLKKTTQSSE